MNNVTPTVDLCRCGHHADVHKHYRNGTDCGLCSCQAVDVLPAPSTWETWRGPLLAGLITGLLFVGFKGITTGVLTVLGYLP